MKIGSRIAAFAAGALCAHTATAGVEYFPTSSLLAAEAFVGPTTQTGEFDSDHVSAGTPAVANLDAFVNSLGVAAAATVDTEVDWRDHEQRFEMRATITTTLMRTGEIPASVHSWAYAHFFGSAGFTVSEPTTVRIEADATGSGNPVGFRALFYRLDIDKTFLDTEIVPGAGADALLTLEPGTYILNLDAYLLDITFGQQTPLNRETSAGVALSITVVPAPMTACGLAPLVLFAARRRR